MIGALREEEALDDLDQAASFEDRPQLFMRQGHPLAQARTISVADLHRYPWILPPVHTPLRGYWRAMMGGAEADLPHVAIECGSVLTIRELIRESDALTLLSPDQLRVEIEAGLLNGRAPPVPVRRMIGITTRRDWRPTAPQREMIDILQQVAKQIS